MIYIQEVIGREILESRGLPTVEVEIILSNNMRVTASSPAGTSYGVEDAVEIRDKDMSRYHGYGVSRAVEKINKTIAPRLYKRDPQEQFDIDELLVEMDGTPNLANIGANTVLAVSMAVAKAGAVSKNLSLFEHLHYLYQMQFKHMYRIDGDQDENKQKPSRNLNKMAMPEPIFNIINGRESKNSKLDFQDFMVILKGIPDYQDKLRYASEIDHQVQKNLCGSNYYFTSLSNEGGATPDVSNDETALNIITTAIGQLETKLLNTAFLGLDVAATGIYTKSGKTYRIKGGTKNVTADEMIDYLYKFSEKYPIIFYEDALASEDYEGWKQLMARAPEYMGIVGDDLFNGNKEKLDKNRKEKWANAISIKPNQIGSVLNILTLIILAQQQEMKIVVSHRSGETNDYFISDLAVAVGAEYIKSGSPKRGERVAKYNRLLKIEEELKIIQKT